MIESGEAEKSIIDAEIGRYIFLCKLILNFNYI